MDGAAFVEAIKQCVRDSAINGTLDSLTRPTGRKLSQESRDRSQWFEGLSPAEKAFVGEIVRNAVDAGLFGLLCVIDGVRVVEDSAEKGDFELYYVRGENKGILNSAIGFYLHELYSGE